MKRLFFILMVAFLVGGCDRSVEDYTTAVVATFLEQEDERLSRLHPNTARYQTLSEDLFSNYQTIIIYDDGQLEWGTRERPVSEVLEVVVQQTAEQTVYVVNVTDRDVIPAALQSASATDFARPTSFKLTLSPQWILFVVEDLSSEVADEIRSHINRLGSLDEIVDNLELSNAYLFERVIVVQQTQSWDEIPGTPENFELVSGELSYGLLTYKYRIDDLLPGWQSSLLSVIDKVFFMGPGETDEFRPFVT